MTDNAATNTDRELYREPKGDLPSDHYAPSVHVTNYGHIGMDVGGSVMVLPIHEWHRRVTATFTGRPIRATGGNRFINADSDRTMLLAAIERGLTALEDWADGTDQAFDAGAISVDTKRIFDGSISVSVTGDLRDTTNRRHPVSADDDEGAK